MRQARSLRVRVIVLAAVSIVTALTVAGASLVVIFNRHLDQRLEQELETRLVELAAAFSLDATGEPKLNAFPSDPQYQYPYSGSYWQVSDANGRVDGEVSHHLRRHTVGRDHVAVRDGLVLQLGEVAGGGSRDRHGDGVPG